MGRSQIFEAIYSTLSADAGLLAVLGTQTPTNRRIYRNHVQLQSFLAGPPVYEPAVDEGWLVVEETKPGLMTSRGQYDTIFEIIDLNFHVFATHYGVGDDVADFLDAQYHWSIEQQRDVAFGPYYVFFSRAFQSGEDWAKEILLAQKMRQYRFELVRMEQVA